MVLEEVMAALEPERRVPVQIVATDLNAEAIDVARRAVYPARIAEEVGPERLQRHFVPAGTGWRVAQPVTARTCRVRSPRPRIVHACRPIYPSERCPCARSSRRPPGR